MGGGPPACPSHGAGGHLQVQDLPDGSRRRGMQCTVPCIAIADSSHDAQPLLYWMHNLKELPYCTSIRRIQLSRLDLLFMSEAAVLALIWVR